MRVSLLLALLAIAAPVSAKKKPADAPPPAKLPTSIDGLPIGAIGKQQLPATGCAVFLWSLTPSHALVAMLTADPAQVRMSVDGSVADYARTAQNGEGGYGFAQTTEYRGGDITTTVDMAVVGRPDLANGATVLEATIRVDRPGRDSLVLPVAGMIGCA